MAALGLHLSLHQLPCLCPSSSLAKHHRYMGSPPVAHNINSSALRRPAPFLKDTLSLRCPAPCCMSVEVDSEKDDLSLDPRRGLEERFAVINTGKWECRSCAYTYDESTGDSSYPIAAGIEFGQLPEDWRCPTCGAGKSYFSSKSVEVAGFAQNQKYGLGTNSLTAGQKSLLIYGSLFFFFILFLSGYFIQ